MLLASHPWLWMPTFIGTWEGFESLKLSAQNLLMSQKSLFLAKIGFCAIGQTKSYIN